MTVYYINLLLILALAYPLCIRKPNKIKKIAYLALTLSYMWFLATFREGIGYDYGSYIDIFQAIASTDGLQNLLALGHEPGFTLIMKLISLFTADSVVLYGALSALILIPVGWFVYRYCKDAWLSVWLYVTLTFFYTIMNFVRQSLACSVILFGYRFLKEKKPVPYFIVVLLAASMHKTALIMIPVYFLCHIRLDKKMGAFYASATLLLYLTSGWILDKITDYIFTYYKGSVYIDTQYGFSLVFLVVPAVIFGACLALRYLWEKWDPAANMLLNLMMYSAIGWLFITKHFVIERFTQYMYIFALIAVPAAISSLKAPEEDYARLAEMRAESKRGKGKSKEEQHKLRTLSQSISDHQKYYWSAVVALILLTLVYNEFGAHVNEFHKVFPYQSVLEWLNAI